MTKTKSSREWLRQKRSLEEELYQCFNEMMMICKRMRRRYRDIPKEKLQEYLNLGRIDKADSDNLTEEELRRFKSDLDAYVQMKHHFYDCSFALRALEFERM